MRTPIIQHAGKGSQQILPSKAAVDQLVNSPQTTINQYAKAGPSIVQNGPNMVERGK